MTRQQSKTIAYYQGSLKGEELKSISVWARRDAERMEQVLRESLHDREQIKELDRLLFDFMSHSAPVHVLMSLSKSLTAAHQQLNNDFALYESNPLLRKEHNFLGEEEIRKTITLFRHEWQQERWRVVRPLLLQIRNWIRSFEKGSISADDLRLAVESLDREALPLLSFLTSNPSLHDAMERFLLDLSLFEPSPGKLQHNALLLNEQSLRCEAKTLLDTLNRVLA